MRDQDDVRVSTFSLWVLPPFQMFDLVGSLPADGMASSARAARTPQPGPPARFADGHLRFKAGVPSCVCLFNSWITASILCNPILYTKTCCAEVVPDIHARQQLQPKIWPVCLVMVLHVAGRHSSPLLCIVGIRPRPLLSRVISFCSLINCPEILVWCPFVDALSPILQGLLTLRRLEHAAEAAGLRFRKGGVLCLALAHAVSDSKLPLRP